MASSTTLGHPPRDRWTGSPNDVRSALAARVWMSTVVFGAALASIAMTVSLVVQLHTNFSWGFVPWAPVLIGSAAVVGWVAGAVIGIPLGVFVTFAHRSLGVRAVTILLPLLALLISGGALYGFHVRSPLALAIAAFLTVAGGVFVSTRYRQLALASRVH
jgi:hypothetical protein